MSFKSLAVLAAALPAAFAQFVTPPTDLKTTTGYAGYQVRYKQVPNNICETNANVKSYSGYVTLLRIVRRNGTDLFVDTLMSLPTSTSSSGSSRLATSLPQRLP